MDMESLMAQAQELQNKISDAQDKLADVRVKGIAGNGDCIIELSGKYDLIDIKIKEDVLSQGAGAVEKIVAFAYRDAKQKADVMIDKVMGEATAGMPLPN